MLLKDKYTLICTRPIKVYSLSNLKESDRDELSKQLKSYIEIDKLINTILSLKPEIEKCGKYKVYINIYYPKFNTLKKFSPRKILNKYIRSWRLFDRNCLVRNKNDRSLELPWCKDIDYIDYFMSKEYFESWINMVKEIKYSGGINSLSLYCNNYFNTLGWLADRVFTL